MYRVTYIWISSTLATQELWTRYFWARLSCCFRQRPVCALQYVVIWGVVGDQRSNSGKKLKLRISRFYLFLAFLCSVWQAEQVGALLSVLLVSRAIFAYSFSIPTASKCRTCSILCKMCYVLSKLCSISSNMCSILSSICSMLSKNKCSVLSDICSCLATCGPWLATCVPFLAVCSALSNMCSFLSCMFRA